MSALTKSIVDISHPSVKDNQSSPYLRSVDSGRSTRGQNCQTCNLNKICLSNTLDNDDKHALDTITRQPRASHKGEHLYRQGDAFCSIYIVRSGSVKLYQVTREGEEFIVGFYLPGELFGTDGMLNGQHSYSAEVMETTAVCEVPFQSLENSFASHPEIQRTLLITLCSEIHERQQPLLQLQHKRADQRLATFLMDISSRISKRGLSEAEFNLPMSRRDLAHFLGMTEETISRIFTRFQNEQILIANRRQIKINDFDALQNLSPTLH